MEYKQITIPVADQEQKEILVALLENISYEGFEENDDSIIAYIPGADYHEDELKTILGTLGLSHNLQTIQQQNWNAQWESNFEPVIVEGFCTIRAAFHNIEINTPYQIVITPKMSFGTGHHATTRLMMQQMSKIDFKGRKVLDFGTGTGILAILAEMLGAGHIMAIDNDEWSYENTKENKLTNNCRKIAVFQGSLEISDNDYDIILANINRHILLNYMNDMYMKIKNDGLILMSGLLKEDREIIMESATTAGFKLLEASEENNWIALLFRK
jgi:ribosomal protein L11 methyltransferase